MTQMDILCCCIKPQSHNSKDLENAYARRGSIVNVQQISKSESEEFDEMANVIVKSAISKAANQVKNTDENTGSVFR